MMKSVTIFLSSFLLLFLVSCKKDAAIIAPVKYTGNILVNFNNYSDADGNGGYTKVETSLTNSYQDVNVEVKLTNTTEGAPNDIYVYLIKVDALVTDYNAKHGTTLTPVGNTDAALQYDFSKPVVIKKGEKKAMISMKVNPLKFDLTKQNAIGIAILKVDGAAVNNDVQSKLVIEFGARNKYDGRYSISGTFQDVLNPGFTALYPLEWELVSSGENQCIVYDNVNLGTPGYLFSNNGSSTYYGSFGLVVNFDPSGNGTIVSVVNYYGQPAANTRSAQLDPTGTNKFDNSTKKILIKYFMLQPSSVPTPPSIRARFNETWTYLGPR